MTQYLMSVYYDEGATQPPAEELAQIVANVDAVHQALRDDAALGWAERMSDATTCPIEVSPIRRPASDLRISDSFAAGVDFAPSRS